MNVRKIRPTSADRSGHFISNWKMALAALWVLPVSFGILFLTSGIRGKSEQRVDQAQMACADGQITLLTLFAFLILVSRVYDPLIGALDNLMAMMLTLNIQCRRMDEILSHPGQEGTEKLTNRGYDITFDHVGFSYNSGETVLKDVSVTAKQGQVTALVGPSGGGKTTVSRLVSRFWDIQKGKITVDGMDISKIDPGSLMSLYPIVFQDVTLFNNTVMENIRLGRKDARAGISEECPDHPAG